MIPDDLLERVNVRAVELGWDVRWVDTPGQQRKIVVIDPAEPEPFNKLQLTLGDSQSWWSGALELGLIDSVEIDDLFNVIHLQAAIDESRQVLLRLNDQTTWLGNVLDLGRARKALTLRCRVRQVALTPNSAELDPEDEEKVIPANTVREIVYLKTSDCPGCSQEYWFAPHETGDICSHCGAFVENEHQAESQICDDCGAIRPCKCDIWTQTYQARAQERRDMHDMQLSQATDLGQHVQVVRCQSSHRFKRGPEGTHCEDCRLPVERVPTTWHWVFEGELAKALPPIIVGESRGPLT